MLKAFQGQALAQTLEAEIRSHRVLQPDVHWASEMIFPSYTDLSLRNVPHTVAEVLGQPLPNSQALRSDLFDEQAHPQHFDRVFLCLLDGLGYRYLQQLCGEDAELAEIVADLTDSRGPLPLTSVAPSTTAVALTSLWTGGTPSQTGLVGTSLFLREFSTIGNMLSYTPAIGHLPPAMFEQWGMAPESFIPIPGIAQHLAQGGIESHLVLDRQLTGTGLSRFLHRGLQHYHRHMSYSDWLGSLRGALQQTCGQRAYVHVYWPAIDSIGHMYGSHHEQTRHEVKVRLGMLRELCQDPSVQDGRTLVMILADHGHYNAPQQLNIDAMPRLRAAMRMGMTGDSRLAFVHLQDSDADELIAHLHEEYGDVLAALRMDEALAAGFFGADTSLDSLRYRLGEVLLIPRLGVHLADPSVNLLNLVGWHGGLSDWEMLIPLMWRRI